MNMKSVLKKLSSLLPVIAIALTSCSNVDKTVKVALNLDLLSLSAEEKAFPNELTGDELVMMIESKQDFVLYFHQNNCEMCKMVNPYYHQLLTPREENKLNYIPYDLYAFSANSSDFKYIASLYPNLLDQTPKTMFFKKGENILTLANSRYKSFKTFESAIAQFAVPSNIYTLEKKESLDKFLSLTNGTYLLFMRDKSRNQDKGYSSYEYWSNNVYPIIKDSKIPTLLLTYDMLEDDTKKTVTEMYGLSSTQEAVYVQDNYKRYFDYLEETDSKDFINLLNEKF